VTIDAMNSKAEKTIAAISISIVAYSPELEILTACDKSSDWFAASVPAVGVGTLSVNPMVKNASIIIKIKDRNIPNAFIVCIIHFLLY